MSNYAINTKHQGRLPYYEVVKISKAEDNFHIEDFKTYEEALQHVRVLEVNNRFHEKLALQSN